MKNYQKVQSLLPEVYVDSGHKIDKEVNKKIQILELTLVLTQLNRQNLSATLIMTVFMMVGTYLGMPKMSPPKMLADGMGVTIIIGWVMHFIIWIVFCLTLCLFICWIA